MDDRFKLQRFVDAQNPVFEQVLGELRRGRKNSHWMWFIFPQINGLGHSRMAIEFAISSRQEAEAFLNHSVLGPRLRECTRLVNLIEGSDADQIFGFPDNLKFRSCMTLFAHSTKDNQVFNDAVRKYFAGEYDAATLSRLGQPVSPSPSP
ncbi:MAG TPA: DUF1810 domain-containing protein [Stellaceae bacterium]|nr:DUF1810 domain-containing protein [Stellaceae bacterium]